MINADRTIIQFLLDGGGILCNKEDSVIATVFIPEYGFVDYEVLITTDYKEEHILEAIRGCKEKCETIKLRCV